MGWEYDDNDSNSGDDHAVSYFDGFQFHLPS